MGPRVRVLRMSMSRVPGSRSGFLAIEGCIDDLWIESQRQKTGNKGTRDQRREFCDQLRGPRFVIGSVPVSLFPWSLVPCFSVLGIHLHHLFAQRDAALVAGVEHMAA